MGQSVRISVGQGFLFRWKSQFTRAKASSLYAVSKSISSQAIMYANVIVEDLDMPGVPMR